MKNSIAKYIIGFYTNNVMKIVFLTLLFLFSAKSYLLASTIENDKNSYIVKNVRVEGASFENEQSTKQIALSQAKQQALNDLLKYMDITDVSFDDANISAMIQSYKVIDEYYNDSFYALIGNFTFDKAILQSFLNQNDQSSKINSDEIANYIIKIQEKSDIIREYILLKKFLKRNKIEFFPREITATEVSVFVENVNRRRIYDSLKDLGLNGKIYLD